MALRTFGDRHREAGRMMGYSLPRYARRSFMVEF